MTVIAATVSALTATPDILSIALAWTEDDPHGNGAGLSYLAIDKVEVWASRTNDRTTASKVAEGRKTATHAASDERQTWYYWIRPRLADPTATTYGAWYPSGSTAGVAATTGAASDATYALLNGTLVVSRPGGNTCKIEIKTLAGNTPSSSDAVYTHFPNSSGGHDLEKIDYAVSLTFSNGSTVGFGANDPSRLWALLFRTAAGTVVLAAVNCSTAIQIVKTITETGEASSATAEGGAGAADSAGVCYAASSITSKPYRVLGRIDWNSGFGTPGSWSADPSKVVDFRAGMLLPGMESAAFDLTFYTAGSAGTTTVPNDNTIPQDSEGNLLIALTIEAADASPIDFIKTELDLGYFYSALSGIVAAVFWGGSTDARGACLTQVPASTLDRLTWRHSKRYGTVGASSYTVRVGGTSAGTFVVNGNAGGTLGGLIASFARLAVVVG